MSTPATKIYPKHQDDVEFEKEIIEEIQKLTPLSLKLKAFALNHQTLALKEVGTVEDQEIEALDAKSQKDFQQHIPKINELINGTRKPTDEELKDFDKYFTDEERSKKDELLANLKPIEKYWLTVLKNESVIKTQISEDDEKGLAFVTRVEYKLSEDPALPHNFTITFHFAENEYFSNESASVYFHMKEPRDVTKTEGTPIQWKEGKNFTIKQVTKKQKNKKTGQTRTVTKEESVPSFFDFFKTLTAPDESKEELDEEEQQINEEILNQIDTAYSLIEEVIPFSLEYYLGVRKEFGDDGEFDDEDDEDEDDDEEEEAPKKGKGKKPAAKGPGGAEGKQECKQQ